MTTLAARPRLEVADILRAHGAAYRHCHPLFAEQAAVLRRLAACRTAALGGHVEACDRCGYARIAYNSCRDRHCPKCQAAKRAQWLEVRLERLLPVEYFHVVFTLPDSLNSLIRHNQRRLYDLLFQAAAQTLLTLAADPKRLGAQIGVTAILHTWGQNLLFHPHLHCVVTGGGFATDGSRWVAGRANYFLPVKVLGRMFRGKFLDGLRHAHAQDELSLTGSIAELAEPQAWRRLIDRLYRQEWVVYAKRPFGDAERVFRYLGRYSHRVAISNARLLTLENGHVSFHYKDYADEHRLKVMRLSAAEFIRRFLLHVLPKRFVRIRHYGLLAGRNVHTRLARCRQLLADTAPPTLTADKPDWLDQCAWLESKPIVCPHCHGPLVRQPLAVVKDMPAGTNARNQPIIDALQQSVGVIDSS
jgi:putative transposase/transposase-like zinc-binding protein